MRRVDLRGREEGVHAEGACLVRDYGHEPGADLRVLHQVLEQADERHRGGDWLAPRTLLEVGIGIAAAVCRTPFSCGGSGLRERQRLGADYPLWPVATERRPAIARVLDLVGIVAGVVVGRQLRFER